MINTLIQGIGISLFLLAPSEAAIIELFHYNIKELDSTKIQRHTPGATEQLNFALEVLKKSSPDILSLNEVQYDLRGVPTRDFISEAQNIKIMGKLIGLENYEYTFDQANTGNQANRNENGDYVLRPSRGELYEFADLVNFGLIPGQYSTGGLFKGKIKSKKVIASLEWRKFRKDFDPSVFTDALGNPLPRSLELFDKNFTDVTLDIAGKELHVILLHTVPAHHFGNKNSPNYLRNGDQLEFLHWYLTGESSFELGDLNIQPLKKGTPFIAIGDWNIAMDTKRPGSKVLQKLSARFKMAHEEGTMTYIGSSFGPGGFKSQFDYILLGPEVKLVDSGVYLPDAEREELGCDKDAAIRSAKGKVMVSYSNKDGERCRALVDRDYYVVRKASDHLPIWAKVEI